VLSPPRTWAAGNAAPAAGSGAATGAAKAAPHPAAATPRAATGCTEGLAAARAQILAYCATLAFPNGAIHAVRALGRHCPLGPGDPFRILLENFLVENPQGERSYLEVPVEREGHRNAMLKTLIEKGCEPELEFSLHGKPYRFQDYIDSARALASYPGVVTIDEHSWTIIAMSLVTPPAQARWNNHLGQSVDLQRMIDDTSAALWKDTEMIRQTGLQVVDPPRNCPVYLRACGGLHMLYALAVAHASGYETPARRRSFAGHMQTLVRRFSFDENLTASVERDNVKLAGEEAAWVVSYDARVKFLGHALETVGVVDRHKLYAFTAAERRQIDLGRERLCEVLAAGRDLKFERYAKDAFLYDSMTTNLCHAYNALQLSPG
jgi:hypothetical protein